MALLWLSNKAGPGMGLLRKTAFSTHAPTVFDKMVQLTVIDLIGNRHIVRGMEGEKLIDVLAEHVDELGGDDVIGLSPEGRGLQEAHVTVPNEYLTTIPEPIGTDLRNLGEIAPVYTKNSRLASQISLKREFNNLTVALGRIQPWRTV